VIGADGSTDNADLGALLQYTITGLERGTGYTVRVSAWNGVGDSYGSAQFSTPAVVKASRLPDSPASAWVQPAGPRSLLVSWEEPANTGYDDITSYNVAWDTNSGALEVQRVTVAPAVAGTSLHGTFTLRFRDVRTTPLQWDATPQEVALALEALSAVGDVTVDRSSAATGGYVWLVTFLTNVGDQVREYISACNETQFHILSHVLVRWPCAWVSDCSERGNRQAHFLLLKCLSLLASHTILACP
jgi:hypothetical protein